MPLLHTMLSLQVWYKSLSTLAVFEDIIWWRERDIGQKDLSRPGVDTVVSVSAQSRTGSQIKEKESTIQQYVNNVYAREITRNCWSTSTRLGMQTWIRDPRAHRWETCVYPHRRASLSCSALIICPTCSQLSSLPLGQRGCALNRYWVSWGTWLHPATQTSR